MRSQVIDYRGVLSVNRETFLLNFHEEFQAFTETVHRLINVSKVVSTTLHHKGYSLVSHLPWLMIVERQFLNSFESMSTFRSYDAWVLLRPAIESALIMGKWLDDPKNADIWKYRDNDRKAYRKTYEGNALISKSLFDSPDIRAILSRINEDFMHSNPRYYFRHAERSDVDPQTVLMKLRFNDVEAEHEAHFYAFLHLTRFIVHSVGRMFAVEFGELPELNADLQKLQDFFKERVIKFATDNPDGVPVLTELGLWPGSLFTVSS